MILMIVRLPDCVMPMPRRCYAIFCAWLYLLLFATLRRHTPPLMFHDRHDATRSMPRKMIDDCSARDARASKAVMLLQAARCARSA